MVDTNTFDEQALIDLVEKYGYIPHTEEDVPKEEVTDWVHRLHQRAEEHDESVNGLLLELKRLISLKDGLPEYEDVVDWDGNPNAELYEEIFGSIETAVEIALVVETTELKSVLNQDRRD